MRRPVGDAAMPTAPAPGHPRLELGAAQPSLAGPKATSSRTVGMKSWSSGSWKTMPTRRRTSAGWRLSTGSPATRTVPGTRRRGCR